MFKVKSTTKMTENSKNEIGLFPEGTKIVSINIEIVSFSSFDRSISQFE